MPKTTPWREIRDARIGPPGKRSREVEAAYKAARTEMLDDIISYNLAEIRKLRDQTQTALANELGVTQAAVADTEHREDLKLSTLRAFIEALGGHLRVLAVFDDDLVVPVELSEKDAVRSQATAGQ